jgi:hypothetical protein
MADNMSVTPGPTGIIPESESPGVFMLMQNYPNPFNPSTTIYYQIGARSYVTLRIFDVLGREVWMPVNGIEQPGLKSVSFNAEGLTSGVYYYRLRAGSFVETKMMVLIK